MHRFFAIVLLFPVILILSFCIALVNYTYDATSEMSEIMVRDCADSANDAAVEEALRTMNIDSYNRVTIDVEQVWSIYKSTFLTGMNLYSEKNMEVFEGYVPAIVIAVNDGYFVRLRTTETVNGVVQPVYRFSQKIPYARVIGSNMVADTMNGFHIYSATVGTISSGSVYLHGEDTPVTDNPGGIHDTSAIARELIAAMDYCIEVENSEMSNMVWDAQRFYLPEQLLDSVYYDAVTFEGFAMFTLIQGFDMKGNKPVDYFTMANTQIVDATHYICVERDGNLYYRPSKVGLTTDETYRDSFTTKEFAAIAGFGPDPKYYSLT